MHEVTSPQAFEGKIDLFMHLTRIPLADIYCFVGLKNAGRKVRRPDCTLASMLFALRTLALLILHDSDGSQCANFEPQGISVSLGMPG